MLHAGRHREQAEDVSASRADKHALRVPSTPPPHRSWEGTGYRYLNGSCPSHPVPAIVVGSYRYLDGLFQTRQGPEEVP